MRRRENLKLLHLIDTSRHGGAEAVLVRLLTALDDKRFVHLVLLPEVGWLSMQLARLANVEIVFYNGRGRFNLSFLLYLVRLVRKRSIDLVHAHLFGTSLYSALAGLFCQVPVVCTVHGFIDLPEKGRFYRLKLNLLGMLASRIVTVSDCLKVHMQGLLGRWQKKVVTIYNGVESSGLSGLSRVAARRQFGLDEEVLLVGAIGNFKQAKRYDLLLRAAREVLAKGPDCRFAIVGRYDSTVYNEVAILRKELGLEDTVGFLGYRQDVADFLQAIDLYVLCSESEGFSLAIVEAMSAAVPVVATRCGGPEEIVTHNLDGLLVDFNDAAALAAAIRSLLASSSQRSRLVANAQDTVRDRFSVHGMRTAYEQLYARLLDRAERGAEYEQAW